MSGLLDTAARLASPWAYTILGLLAAAESAAQGGPPRRTREGR